MSDSPLTITISAPAAPIEVPAPSTDASSSSSSNANSVEPLTPTASAVKLNPTVLPSSSYIQPVADETNPLRHPSLLAPWPLLKVIQKNQQNAIITVKDMQKGDRLALFYGEVQTKPTMYTLQIDENVHVTCSEGGPTYTNHSCAPNSYFDMSSITAESPFPILTALKDIKAGDEITFHYCHNEYDMAEPFSCLCGEKECLGKIEGFAKLTLEQKQMYEQYLNPFIMRKWKESQRVQQERME